MLKGTGFSRTLIFQTQAALDEVMDLQEDSLSG
jgi:hypothetical protein